MQGIQANAKQAQITAIVPPAGLYQPVHGFGRFWREAFFNPAGAARDRLGRGREYALGARAAVSRPGRLGGELLRRRAGRSDPACGGQQHLVPVDRAGTVGQCDRRPRKQKRPSYVKGRFLPFGVGIHVVGGEEWI